MSTVDTDFYRAFAARVRTQLATTTREGDPTMSTDIAETTKAAAPVPATFRPATPHDAHPWCSESNPGTDCYGPEISLPSDDGSNPGILVGQLHYDSDDDATALIYQRYADWIRVTPDELRAETAKVRAHLARLDALADQFDAIREAAGHSPQTAGGGHFPWCAPGQCIEHPERQDWPTEHQGQRNELPDSRGWKAKPIGYSRLVHCPDDGGDVQISTTFRGEGTTYTAAEADVLIGDLEAFLTGLKAQRAQMGAQLRNGSAR